MCHSQPRFVADVMLGSLARWLRILGYDVLYDRNIDDRELVELSVAEGRIALTRDRRLVRRKRLSQYCLIESDDLHQQILEVMSYSGEKIQAERLLSRCIQCNVLLEPVSPSSVAAEIPPYVYRTRTKFSRCPRCRKVYWRGSHRERMMERLRGLQAAQERSW